MKILVIEDDTAISELICMNLEAAGEVDLVLDRVYDGVLPESMMTINAMDGTIVDRSLGY